MNPGLIFSTAVGHSICLTSLPGIVAGHRRRLIAGSTMVSSPNQTGLAEARARLLSDADFFVAVDFEADARGFARLGVDQGDVADVQRSWHFDDAAVGVVLVRFLPATKTRQCFLSIESILPVSPRALPVSTMTSSPLRSLLLNSCFGSCCLNFMETHRPSENICLETDWLPGCVTLKKGSPLFRGTFPPSQGADAAKSLL